jgi:TonB family protein
MKLLKPFLIIILSIMPFITMAQTDSVYAKPDKLPEYVGGENAKNKFIQKNLKYPKSAVNQISNGKVIAEAIVEKDGSLSNIRIIRKLNPIFDKEVERVISIMPKWKPAYHENKPVRSRVTIPVVFISTDSE